jgi:iron complex outermembrane receptor protein
VDPKYDDVLPNVGVSYDITSDLTVYASYAETLSAPRTDDLYDRTLVDPGPETAKAYDLGLRYQTPTLMISGAVWYNDFSNRIERVFDEAAGIAISANVGDVKLQGFDAQIGWQPVEYLSACTPRTRTRTPRSERHRWRVAADRRQHALREPEAPSCRAGHL